MIRPKRRILLVDDTNAARMVERRLFAETVRHDLDAIASW